MLANTEPQLTHPDHLAIDVVTGFLGVTNNELKCLTLAALSTNVPVPESDVFNTIMIESGGMPVEPLTKSAFGLVVERMPDQAVITEAHDKGERTFTRTETGELATALGGHLLNLSKVSSISTRVILGEHSPARPLTNGRETIDSFEARLIVLHGLFTMALGRWQRSGSLYDMLEENGLDRRAASSHIRQLVDSKLVERRTRPNPRGGSIFENRLAPTNEFFGAPELVRRFLTIIGRFAVLDPTFIGEGLEYADDIVHDRVYVPGLVQRTVFRSSHYGKAYSRSNGDASSI